MVWAPSTCCGIGRRTASYIIASITAIYCTWDLVMSIHYISNGRFDYAMRDMCMKLTDDSFQDGLQDGKCFDAAHKPFIGLISARLVMEILHVIFSFLLIHGVRKNIPRLMVPYMVLMLIAIILLTLTTAFLVVVLMFFSVRASLIAALIAVVIFIMTYFNLVVRALYKEMNEPLKNNFTALKA